MPTYKRILMKKLFLHAAVLTFLTTIFSFGKKYVGGDNRSYSFDTLQYPEEKHFLNLRQLTFGADNAEAYWSYDDKYIIFQRTAPKEGVPCVQMFIGKVPLKE